MLYLVRDSDTGDALGTIEVPDDAADEQVLDALLAADYIQPPAEYYHISEGDFLADDGDKCVRDEYGEPFLLLEPDGPGDEEDDDDDDDDEPTEESDE